MYENNFAVSFVSPSAIAIGAKVALGILSFSVLIIDYLLEGIIAHGYAIGRDIYARGSGLMRRIKVISESN